MKDFKKLKIWENGMELIVMTYKFSEKLPPDERFGLRSQMTSAAVSIPSNIAEGSARKSSKDYLRFLEYSLGSAYELETQVLAAQRLNFGDEHEGEELLRRIDEEQKMIHGFISAIERR